MTNNELADQVEITANYRKELFKQHQYDGLIEASRRLRRLDTNRFIIGCAGIAILGLIVLCALVNTFILP